MKNAADSDEAEVRELLERFARAVTAGDTGELASLWAIPAFVMGDEGVRVVGSREEIERFFVQARAQYDARGVTGTRPEIVRVEWISQRVALVDVRWPWLDAQGHELGAESSTYALRRDESDELKVCVAFVREVTHSH